MAYVYDPRTGYYNENYQDKPTGLQEAQTASQKAQANRTQSSIPIDEQRAMSEEQLQAAQSEQAKANAWRARNVMGKSEQMIAKGGPVKDPRATRRMYAKGGPIFR